LKSAKQSCTANSTTESFVAFDLAGKEIKWLRELLADIPLSRKQTSAVSMHCDN